MSQMLKSFEMLALDVMKVMESIDGTKTSRNVRGANCKGGHSDEIQNLKIEISFLKNKIFWER